MLHPLLFNQMAQTHRVNEVTLVLTDDINKVVAKFDKIVLIQNSAYFHSLLTNFRESTATQIVVIVPNAYITYDILMKFCHRNTNRGGLPQWRHALESIKCYDFFCLPYDDSIIFTHPIPPEGFDLLLEVVNIIGYDNRIIKLINQVLPEDYDVTGFPRDVINKMIKYSYGYKVITGSADNSIRIWNLMGLKWNPDTTIPLAHHDAVSYICISNDLKKIASKSRNQTAIKIWDVATGTMTSTFNYLRSGIFYFSHDAQYLILIDYDKVFSIWNIAKGEFSGTTLRLSQLSQYIKPNADVCYYNQSDKAISRDCTKISVLYHNMIKVYDSSHTLNRHSAGLYDALDRDTSSYRDGCEICFTSDARIVRDKTGKITIYAKRFGRVSGYIHTDIKFEKRLNGLCCSPNEKLIAYSDGHVIYMWSLEMQELVSMIVCDNSVTTLCFSSDSKLIISGHVNGIVNLWRTRNSELVDTLRGHQGEVCSITIVRMIDTPLARRLKKIEI